VLTGFDSGSVESDIQIDHDSNAYPRASCRMRDPLGSLFRIDPYGQSASAELRAPLGQLLQTTQTHRSNGRIGDEEISACSEHLLGLSHLGHRQTLGPASDLSLGHSDRFVRFGMGAETESVIVAVILHALEISIDRHAIDHQRWCGVIFWQFDPTHQKTFQNK
jgi:hypothetical protein